MNTKPLLLAVLMTAVTLAGCISAEDAPAPTETDDADEAKATDSTGAVKGKIVNEDLQRVGGATVALVAGADIVQQKTTNEEGKYVFNDVAPGDYKVQVSAICCKATIKSVTIAAGEVATVDLQMALLSAEDLKEPRVDEFEWEGFISCGVGVAGAGLAACSLTSDTPAEDSNEEFSIDFPVYDGLKSVVIGVEWQPVGSVFGTDLWLLFEDWHGCSTACSDVKRWGDVRGGPGIATQVDHDTNDEVTYWEEEGVPENATAHDWDNYIEGEDEFRFRVFASGNANLLYQQPFTVHYHLFYHEKAPEDYNPFPDN